MQNVRVPDLEIGMVLAEDVRDMNGRRLLSAGCSINDKCLHILKTWGILDVMISASADAQNAPDDLEVADEDQSESREIFSLMDRKNPLIQELWKRSLEIHRQRGYSRFSEPRIVNRNRPPAQPCRSVRMQS